MSSAVAQDVDFVLWQQLTGVSYSDADWADFDSDGDLDLAIAGRVDFVHPVCQTYENQSGTLVYRQDLVGVVAGDLAWGDYDGDGDLDLALAGNGITRIYENDGSGNLNWDTQQVLTGVWAAAVAWGDYDNDGDLDLVVTGWDETAPNVSILYRNEPHGLLTPDPLVSLTGLHWGTASWADYDGDADLDLLLTGTTSLTFSASAPDDEWAIFYENDPVGTLTNDGDHGVPGIWYLCGTAWGDYDNDGDLDLALSGHHDSGYGQFARVYGNDGAGNFTQVAHLLDSTGDPAWGDYDNDGDLDLGFTGFGCCYVDHAKIYENAAGSFTEAFSLQEMCSGPVNWADVDQDGDLDFFLAGLKHYTYERYAQLYENVGGTPNTLPSPPTEFSEEWTADGLRLSWSGAIDAETPTAGLYYCLRVGTSPGGHDVVSGTYGSPLMGNVGQATEIVLDVPQGAYYWSVRAIDSGLMASPRDTDDTDGDGLFDITELEMAEGSGCPDPLDADSDDDTLLDGHEVDVLGTNPCSSDTDGDGVPDNEDPEPTEPGVTSGWLEDVCRQQAEEIRDLPLGPFNGPNNNANSGRRNSLANRVTDAANAIAEGDIAGAIESLTSLLDKIDGESPPPDWMDDSPERTALADEINLLIVLLEMELE